MNAKEAREIVKKTHYLTNESSFSEEDREDKDARIDAIAFLDCHEQVKPLVEAMERAISTLNAAENRNLFEHIISGLDNALSHFREQMGEE